MRNESEQAKNTCCIFLHFLNDKKWEEACQLLSEDFEAYLPQLKEDIIGPDNFIELIRLNLDNHKIQIQDTTCEYDQWGKEFKVVTRVHIESKMTDEKVLKLFKISFFLKCI